MLFSNFLLKWVLTSGIIWVKSMMSYLSLLCSLFYLLCHTMQLRAQGDAQILLKIRNGQIEEAFSDYRSKVTLEGKSDYELIHRMALSLIEYGSKQSDAEIQLLSLFGAYISAHDEVYHILEEGLKNRYPQIQLIALKALAHLNNDQADQALLRAMGSDYPLIRLEAAHSLCEKKHPQAINQIESFMYKLPSEALPLFPPLYAQVGTPQAMKLLRKMINHPSTEVRLAVILSVAMAGRDDFIPQIRQQALHGHFSQQEACALALGLFQDGSSRDLLTKMSCSPYPHVALAANVALYKLGEEKRIEAIEKAALKGDLFAIVTLGEISDHPAVLLQLLKHPNSQVKYNAVLALLQQHHPSSAPYLKDLLTKNKYDYAVSEISSPGKGFKAWKVTPSASLILKEDVEAYLENLKCKQTILTSSQSLPNELFIQIADQLLSNDQNELVPLLVELLQEQATQEAIQCLKTYQQKLGDPFVRNYCTLALYRMQEPGPYGAILHQWVNKQNKTEFIRFKPLAPWQIGKNTYDLTPEQTSEVLLQACEAMAINQDDHGIEALIEAISFGHAKNRYALAGILLRATR